MKFHCTSCGRKLSVPDARAGKKGRCPKCKEVLTIPDPAGEPEKSPHDLELLDVPPADTNEAALVAESDESAAAYEQLQGALGGRLMKPDEIPQRKYPWIIDIFLYPLNLSALTMVLICVGGPFFLRVVVTFFKVFTIHIPVLLIAWLMSLMIHWAAIILLGFYMIWYVFACVRDSAHGGIRAPNTAAATPGLSELIVEFFRLLACLVFCMAPALVFAIRGGGADPLFWTLFAAGGSAFPMALLAVIMYESLGGLNPLLIVRSIVRTFLHYLVLVPFCYALCLMFPLAYRILLDPHQWHWSYLLQALDFCLLMVMAHLLGRFYWKNQEKLDWDA